MIFFHEISYLLTFTVIIILRLSGLSDELNSENAGSIRDDLAHLQERNQYLEEEVETLKETIERYVCFIITFSAPSFGRSKFYSVV